MKRVSFYCFWLLCMLVFWATSAQAQTLSGSLPTLRSVEVAGNHTCVIPLQGLSQCWGAEWGYIYSRGSGAGAQLWPQDETRIRNSYQMDLSESGTCALQNGSAVCWGSAATRSLFGVHAPAIWNFWLGKIAVGNRASCGIPGVNDSGSVWCWEGSEGNNLDVPDQVKNIESGFLDIATSHGQPEKGFDEWCAVNVNNNLFCWDSSEFTGGNNSKSLIHRIPANLGMVKKVAMSPSTICVIKKDGYLRCWGKATGVPRGIKNPLQIRAGQTSCALLINHQIKCWGQPLGIAHKLLRRMGGIRWISDLNTNHRCLVRGNGKLYCWGSDRYGQISGRPNSILPQADLRLFAYKQPDPEMGPDRYLLGMYADGRREKSDSWRKIEHLTLWSNYPETITSYWQASRTGAGSWHTLSDMPKSFAVAVGAHNIPAGLHNHYLRACSRAWNEHGSGLVCTQPFFWTKPSVPKA